MTRERKRWYVVVAAGAGVGLFVWTIVSVGARELAAQLGTLAPILPLILTLAGLRFVFQAAGWRLAMSPAERPPWREAFAAVVAGEAVGYFAWGPVSREPVKALLIGHRVPKRAALAAAVVERLMYTLAAATLILAAVGITAVRYNKAGWFLLGLATLGLATALVNRFRPRRAADRRQNGSTVFLLAALAAAQEITNVLEAYLVLGWLGAAPTFAAVVVLEGGSRLMNGAVQFIPGKFGVTEAATTALAEGLRLGGAHGLSLALARRARSLAWAAIGITLVAVRAVKWHELRNDAMRSFRNRGALHRIPADGLLH